MPKRIFETAFVGEKYENFIKDNYNNKTLDWKNKFECTQMKLFKHPNEYKARFMLNGKEYDVDLIYEGDENIPINKFDDLEDFRIKNINISLYGEYKRNKKQEFSREVRDAIKGDFSCIERKKEFIKELEEEIQQKYENSNHRPLDIDDINSIIFEQENEIRMLEAYAHNKGFDTELEKQTQNELDRIELGDLSPINRQEDDIDWYVNYYNSLGNTRSQEEKAALNNYIAYQRDRLERFEEKAKPEIRRFSSKCNFQKDILKVLNDEIQDYKKYGNEKSVDYQALVNQAKKTKQTIDRYVNILKPFAKTIKKYDKFLDGFIKDWI